MARTFPDIVVTNSGQPLVVQIEPLTRTATFPTVTPALASGTITVTISPIAA